METNVLDERRRFVADVMTGQWSMSELCERYGISRPTGYKDERKNNAYKSRGTMV